MKNSQDNNNQQATVVNLKNERLNGTISWDEYTEKYDLDNEDVWKQQAEQLTQWEMTQNVLGVLFKAFDIKDWNDFITRQRKAYHEGEHFKQAIRNKIETNESV